MKIVIDARFLGTETGIGRYIKELVENLENIDSANNYVIFLRKENFNLYNPKNKNFTKKLADIKWYTLREQIFMGRLIDKEKADIAHFPHFNVPFFCRTPYIVTIHDLILRHFPTSAASTRNPIIFYIKYFLYSLVLRRAIKKSKKIIVPSYFVRNDILSVIPATCPAKPKGRSGKAGISFHSRGIPDRVGDDREQMADKIRVIYEGISELPKTDLGKEFLERKGLGDRYILYVGNAYPHKNLKNLCEAFFELKKEMPEVQLVLAGKRDYFSYRLEFQVSSFKFQDIIFYGLASDEELSTLYKHASLYVFPSLMEGFGLPAIEALSYGLPAAVSDIPVFHEILGDAVSYFNPQDIKEIGEVLKNALKNNESRDDVLKRTKNLLARYDWMKTVKETMEAYESVERGKRRARPL